MPEPTKTNALLAISGGRDSVALLHLLFTAGHRQIILCHLNHGLRGRESGQDAAFVRRLAKQYGLPCEVEKTDVAALANQERISIETAGRNARYAFLRRMAIKHQASQLFLAHHADDQAETILAHLCRGAGMGGLRGMLEQSSTQPVIVRPLLQVQRAAIDAYIREHGLVYREDSSNGSLSYQRNRLRLEILPLLNAVCQRDVAPLIARLGRLAGRDDEYLWQQVMDFLQKEKPFADDGSLSLSSKLTALHPAVLSRLLSFWLVEKLAIPGIDSEIIESVLGMLRPGGVAKINLSGGRHLRRKAKRMWVQEREH